MQNPHKDLKEQLQKLLSEDKPDYSKILEVSTNYAALDPDNIRFTADAALIDRLGLQLVARQETAVSELVKNAYDADARSVKADILVENHARGRLLIVDDGSGMTRDELMNGFMRLASSEKSHQPRSTKFSRQRAGKKGIGRFAVQRLGRRLTLITQTEESTHALRLEIDWSKFERDQNLFSIANRITQQEKDRPHGTVLIIDDLREGWNDQQIARVYRYIEDLLVPADTLEAAKPAKKPTKGKGAVDSSFSVACCRLVGGKEMPIASEETMVTSHALAKVTARVDASGVGTWELTSNKLGMAESGKISPNSANPDEPYTHLRNVRFTAHYFILVPEYVPSLEIPRLRRVAERTGGIRLYCNGFRVPPYGESNNDWLALDKATRQRKILAPVHNLNWFGHIDVEDLEGEIFSETSSREGLAVTPAFQELIDFGHSVALLTASRLQAMRGRKVTAKQKGYKPPKKLADELAKEAKKIEKQADDLESKDDLLDSKGQEIADKRKLAKLLRTTVEQSEELTQEIDMLRVLASLGLTIGVFTHEVSLGFVALESELNVLLARTDLSSATQKQLRELKDHFSILHSYTAYFDRTISENVSRERQPLLLNWTLHNFVREFKGVAARDHIEFDNVEIDPYGLVTPPMHPSEWASILTNLFTNARKAIRRRRNLPQGRLGIKAVREEERLVIDFFDNGDGIPSENQDKIFNAFFTTTHQAPEGSDRDLAGTGLGLKIVKDIVESAGGEIYLATPPDGYSTCMRIEMPAGPIEE